MKAIPLFTIILVLSISCSTTHTQNSSGKQASEEQLITEKVDSLLRLMTLEKKIGQLNQIKGNYSKSCSSHILQSRFELRE